MNKIVCKCGHEIDEHFSFNCSHPKCTCELSKEAVEARYFARLYYKLFKKTLKELRSIKSNRKRKKDELKMENKLISSLPEKDESFKKGGYLEHWMYVWELKKLLDLLKPDDWVIPNDVHNLAVLRDEKLREGQIGFIDFLQNKVVFDDGTEVGIKEEE